MGVGAWGVWIMSKKNKCKGCSLKELDPYKKIHEDAAEKGFLLNYAINPEVDGHLVVQPKFHAGQLYDLNEKQAGRLMKII
jgi:diadenosine tetraphosphate (Ap4A) HIT family hydrolase